MCGEHFTATGSPYCSSGSSPHVRGAHHMHRSHAGVSGIIPACAGSTMPTFSTMIWTRDHPRMCGEHFAGIFHLLELTGSSPHVRGAPKYLQSFVTPTGIIPACAGSTEPPYETPCDSRDHPRMCGEHNGITVGTPVRLGSSPHVRGALHASLWHCLCLGIIPACAGSTLRK